MKTKGQIDSIGLVIIVIILILAVILIIPFLTDDSEVQALNENYLSLKADTTLAVLLSTQIENCQYNFKQELSQCSLNLEPYCFDNCREIYSLIDEIFKNSLKTSEFTLEMENTAILGQETACLNKLTSTQYPLNIDKSIKLSLCS